MPYHATKFFATSHLTLHGTEFFATPCLILGTLLHVLKMMAIESQKLISNTSDVVDAKVITTGETTTPSLLDNIFPSINNFLAGDSHVRDLFEHNWLHCNIFYASWLIWMTFLFEPNWLHCNVPYAS